MNAAILDKLYTAVKTSNGLQALEHVGGDMSETERRHFSGQEKVKIFRLHLLEGKPVSDLNEQHKINPSSFYQRQRTFFENRARAFEGSGNARSQTKLGKQVEALEDRLQRQHEGLSELIEEHIRSQPAFAEQLCNLYRKPDLTQSNRVLPP